METTTKRCENMWKWMKYRTKNRKGYAGIDLKMTKNEFMVWAEPRVENFMFLYPDLTPSPDRIDSDGDYELSNMRIIDKDHNRMISGFTYKSQRLDQLDTEQERIEAFCIVIVATCRHGKMSKQKLIEHLIQSM